MTAERPYQQSVENVLGLRAECSCGWRGPVRTRHPEAVSDRASHAQNVHAEPCRCAEPDWYFDLWATTFGRVCRSCRGRQQPTENGPSTTTEEQR